jgi:hypothetical protein
MSLLINACSDKYTSRRYRLIERQGDGVSMEMADISEGTDEHRLLVYVIMSNTLYKETIYDCSECLLRERSQTLVQ